MKTAWNYRALAFLVLAGLVVGLHLGACASCPDAVIESLEGNARDWRLVKQELVQTMPEGPAKELWMKRFAAFIARARANVAWARGAEDFDTAAAFLEELDRVEPNGKDPANPGGPGKRPADVPGG
jgi:hypothetical protein